MMESSTTRNASPSLQTETPEQLLDVFKAAALSVTKLYKTSALAEAKARAEGYQECLEDLLAFLEKDSSELKYNAKAKIMRWAVERCEGRENSVAVGESDDETDKVDAGSSTDAVHPEHTAQTADHGKENGPAAATAAAPAEPPAPAHFVVPSADTFTFGQQYPNIARLDLSDSVQHMPSQRPARGRNGPRPNRPANGLGRGAGMKRRINYNELFGLGGKDPFGTASKRSRHN